MFDFCAGFSVFLPFIIVLIQLSDAYLRYLAFQSSVKKNEKPVLWLRLFLWSPVALLIYSAVFCAKGITPFGYKLFLMLGWLPYLIIFMYTIRRNYWQHLFVFGMSALWSFSQHNWSSIVAAAFIDPSDVGFFLTVHATLYIFWFLLLLPIERRCFRQLLRASEIFPGGGSLCHSHKCFFRCMALFLLAVLFGPIFLLADDQLLHSWAERFSRLLLPFIFFFFYYNGLIFARHVYERLYMEEGSCRLKTQLAFLQRHQQTIEQNQKTVTVISHDMKHSYRLIYNLLASEKVSEAMDYIKKQEERLEDTSLHPYCSLPLINAALSIYFLQAQKAGINITYKINLPPHLSTATDDLAVLISNLLENAIRACLKQENGTREISFHFAKTKKQIVLEVTNTFDKPLLLGEKGLPYSEETGHGIGMISLSLFAEKYNAYFDFSQENNLVKVAMYWQDAYPPVPADRRSAGVSDKAEQ